MKQKICICVTCGKEFIQKPATHGLYCSRKCFQVDRSRKMGSERVMTTCDYCGKEFSTTKYLLSISRGKHCSRKCKVETQKIIYTGENHGSWKGGKIDVECPTCGKHFKLHKHRIESCRRNFCSKDCKSKWYGIYFQGENSHFYVDGIDHTNGYHCSFSRVENREKVRKLYNNTCIICGRSTKKHGIELAIHHIYPEHRSYKFEDTIYACLCHSCHMRIHQSKSEWNYWTEYFIELIERYMNGISWIE